MFAIFLGLAGKPLCAGVLTFALVGGFAFADLGKREVLREPVVFTDLSELKELVRHPHLYLPFVGPTKVIASAAAATAALVALFGLEPALWPGHALAVSALTAIATAALVFGGAACALAPLAKLLGRTQLTGDPEVDARELGSLAMQFAQGVPTRATRDALRDEVTWPTPARPDAPRPPIVLIQAESFFDPSRLKAGLAEEVIPEFAALRAEAVQAGRLRTANWGANTTRTEFEVLSGRPLETLGFDRYNPYHAFARRRVDSLAWTLKQLSDRLHPPA